MLFTSISILKTLSHSITFGVLTYQSIPLLTLGQTFFFSLSSQLILHAIEENSVNGFISATSNGWAGKGVGLEKWSTP